MGLIPLFVRITRSSFDVKYMALGFDIFQNIIYLLRDIICLCFVKGNISKDMRLFTQAIFQGLVRFVKSSLHVDIGLMGQLVYFPLIHN